MELARPAPEASPARHAGAQLLARLLLFWSPVVLVLGVCEILLWRTGESWPVGRVLEEQGRQPDALFLRGYLDQSFYAYKYSAILQRRPRVLVLGSSRVMKFREAMFGASAPEFYNAGGMVLNLRDLEAFLKRLPPSHTPRVAVLGIDSWWLNDARPDEEGFGAGVRGDGALDWRGHLTAFRALVARPSEFGPCLNALLPGGRDARRIGIQALRAGEGFRRDGSMAGALTAPTREEGWRFEDRERPPVLRRIRRGLQFFEPSTGVSERRFARLRDALVELRGRGILVLGFAPPLFSAAAAALEADPRQRDLWLGYRSRVPALFAELGLPFVDASTPAALGLDDRYLIDGLHAEETFHLHLLRRMLEDPRAAAALPGASKAVEAALASRATNDWYADLRDPTALVRRGRAQ